MAEHAERSQASRDAIREPRRDLLVALAGNPNVGKTTLFNQLTGLRQKVGNYPGVTVEHKTGTLTTPGGRNVELVDVPGTYSLNPRSLDEEVAYRVLIGTMDGARRPDLIVCVVDASNLERNLYLASQVIDLGIPTIVALNMIDAAEAVGMQVSAAALADELGVPVIAMVASSGRGLPALRDAIGGPLAPPPERRWRLDSLVQPSVDALAARLGRDLPNLSPQQRFSDALRALTCDSASVFESHHSESFWREVEKARAELDAAGVDHQRAEVVSRYRWITPLVARVATRPASERVTRTDRVDAIVTHRIAGPILFFALLALIFQSVFAWAVPAMDAIDAGVTYFGSEVGRALPAGPIRGLLVDGVIAGVGAVVIFLPQILILFFFLGLLEDTGYMARAAFIMDRVMKQVGLSGRSVVPLLSGFACAIPGIMAARTIENQRDRLVTILVIPLMTCSARLPVYALLIAAFIPTGKLFGIIGYQGLTLLVMYSLGVALAVAAAWVLKRFVIKGERSLFVMELPPYRMPRMRDVLWRMIERSRIFLSRAGTIILAVSIVLWFLASYPGSAPSTELEAARTAALQRYEQATDTATAKTELDSDLLEIDGRQAALVLENSAMGRLGHAIEPVLAPLGFDWKIGVALIAAFAAREVAVSALATIYSVAAVDGSDTRLIDRLRGDIDPRTGEAVFTPLVAVSLMVWFVIACQCMSTVAVVRRETASWRWPLFMLGYLTVLAWVAAFATYQGGLALGFG
jgi:ferrous iron transport protein B